MSSLAGGGSGATPGVTPGALTNLLREVFASPEGSKAVPPPLHPGTVIGRFEIVRELGRGAFGVVYEARDRELGRPVALKMVRPGAAAMEDGKVVREAEAIARLAHPNLVTLHDVGRSDAGPYLVFELLRGKTLQERIDDGPLLVPEAVHVAVEVARGLAHAHAEGVVHRDLKPANVFVTTGGQVKILDFGMAHAFGRRRLSGGTPAYMAPEQWEDDPEDERTDVFALGVMLHVMLSGAYPFPEGEGRWSAGSATAPRLEVQAAPGLADVVDRMLDRAPKGRPRDGAAVVAALTPIEEALRARPADGSPPSRTIRRKASLGDLVAELKRRRVFRVMVGYGIFAFAVLQVTEPIMHGAHLPEWVLTAALVALGAGFPVVVVLAWVFDLTAHGVRRTPPARALDGPRLSRRRLAALLVAVALVTAAPGFAWHLWQQRGGRGHGTAEPGTMPSIAVLPFADLSPTRDQEYFADGVAEEILNALARVDGLKVIGRTSSFSFKGKAEDLRAIGLRLGVGALLEGSVRREGARIRVTVQVVGAADGYHLWSQSYDRQVTSVISLQQEIASAIAEALRVQLVRGAQPLRDAGRSIDAEAYGEYLKGRQFHARSSEEAFRRAAASYQRAVELAPDFAPAWAMLAHMRGVLADFARSRDEVASYQQGALDAAERSVALAPDLADGFAARGPLRSVISRDWIGARSDLERALRLNPGDAYTHYLHAMFLLAPTGRLREAIGALQRATELDPLRPIAWSSLGALYNATGQLDLARAAFERSLELSPEHDDGTNGLAMTSLLEGQPAKALDTSRRSGSEAGRLLVAAAAAGALGREPEARQALEALTSRFADGSAYLIAAAHAWRGDRDQAFVWLDRALVQRDSYLLGVGYDPLLRRLHADPRWTGFLRKMNLPAN